MSRMDAIRRAALINARAYAAGYAIAHEGCGGQVVGRGLQAECLDCGHPVSGDRWFEVKVPGPEAMQDMLDDRDELERRLGEAGLKIDAVERELQRLREELAAREVAA